MKLVIYRCIALNAQSNAVQRGLKYFLYLKHFSQQKHLKKMLNSVQIPLSACGEV